jgi:hypothetical protein
METIPCPGCRTLLGPEITACPICTRPRSKYEIARAYATLRVLQEKRRRRPYIIAAWVIGLGAAAAAVRQYSGPLSSAAAAGKARALRFVDEARDPARFTTQPTEPAPGTGIAPAEPTVYTRPPIDAPVRSSWSPDPQFPRPTAAVPAAPPAAAAIPKKVEPVRRRPVGDLPLPSLTPKEWVLRGTVYDLLTLRPVPHASFNARFNDARPNENGEPFAADEDGRYLVVLPRVSNGGYEILGDSPDYAPAAFYESDIPYLQLSAAERRDMAQSALTGDVHPTPVTDIPDEDAIHRDLFVVPRR